MAIDKDKFEQLLLDLQQQLLGIAEITDPENSSIELDQTKVGRLSRMDAIQGHAMAQAAGVRRDEQLKQVTLALQRLDDEEYGYCQQCDKRIAEARLDADPTVSLCINCASSLENK